MPLQIKHHLAQRNMTQTALADAVGITRSYMSLLTSGQRDPSPAILEKMAAALGVSVGDLFDQDASAPHGPGMAEPAVEPLRAPDARAQDIAAAMQAQGRQVVLYVARMAAMGAGIMAGDVLAVDLLYRLKPGDLVLATNTDNEGGGQTGIYRWADPWLMPANPADQPRKVGSDGRTAIMGLVIGVWRGRYCPDP